MFNLLRNCQNFLIVAVQFYIPTRNWRVPISPHPHHTLFSVLIIAILMIVKWYLTLVSTYISLVTNDIEHLFKCLLAICIPSWGNVYSSHLPIFSLACLVSCWWAVRVLYIFWILGPYQIYDFWIFSQFCGLSLHSLGSVLWWTKVVYFLFLKIYLFIYLFIFGCVGSSFLCEGFL